MAGGAVELQDAQPWDADGRSAAMAGGAAELKRYPALGCQSEVTVEEHLVAHCRASTNPALDVGSR